MQQTAALRGQFWSGRVSLGKPAVRVSCVLPSIGALGAAEEPRAGAADELLAAPGVAEPRAGVADELLAARDAADPLGGAPDALAAPGGAERRKALADDLVAPAGCSAVAGPPRVDASLEQTSSRVAGLVAAQVCFAELQWPVALHADSAVPAFGFGPLPRRASQLPGDARLGLGKGWSAGARRPRPPAARGPPWQTAHDWQKLDGHAQPA